MATQVDDLAAEINTRRANLARSQRGGTSDHVANEVFRLVRQPGLDGFHSEDYRPFSADFEDDGDDTQTRSYRVRRRRFNADGDDDADMRRGMTRSDMASVQMREDADGMGEDDDESNTAWIQALTRLDEMSRLSASRLAPARNLPEGMSAWLGEGVARTPTVVRPVAAPRRTGRVWRECLLTLRSPKVRTY